MAEKILVVDDELETLRLVGMMLEKQGYQILAASSGQQALDLVKKEKPDLVILDLMMPEMDGLEVARRLRTDPITQNILIVMLTVKSQLDDKLLGFEIGADDYLTKPVQPAELVAHVRAVLNRTKRMAAEPSPVPAHRGHVVGVLSAKGGVGVSTVVINLALTLPKRNRDVLAADFRPGCGSIRLELGIEQSNGLNALLKKKATEIDFKHIEAEIIPYESRVNLLLSSPYPHDAQFANAVDQIDAIVQKLAYMAPVVLLDLGASLTPMNDKVLRHCDSLIIVLEPIPQTVIQTRFLIEDLLAKEIITEDAFDIVLVNKLRTGIQLSFGQVQDLLGYPLAVIFTPVPELAYRAQTTTMPMVKIQPDELTGEQFKNLAEIVARRSRRLV